MEPSSKPHQMSDWSVLERLWLCAAPTLIVLLSLLLKDNLLSIASSITGVLYVILAAKGKLSAYFFGCINCVLYAIVAWGQTLYGEVALNILYYLPLQVVGFCIWRKHLDTTTETVKVRFLGWKGRVLLGGSILVGTFLSGLLLKKLGDELPYVDAFTTVASVIAMTLTAGRYTEQWILWIAINALSIYMWWQRYLLNGDNIATLLMWLIFLITGLYGFYTWHQKAKR